MRFNTNQVVMYIGGLVLAISCLCCLANAASLEAKESNAHLKVKRSPYLRLDELSTKLYLAKNKLGGGLVDPLEIGKRSPTTSHDDSEINLAVVLYDGLLECLDRDKCSQALKILLDNN